MDARTLMHEAQDRGIMLMAFNSVGELTTDPQLAGEGFFRTIPHDGATLTDAGPPYRFASGLREGAHQRLRWAKGSMSFRAEPSEAEESLRRLAVLPNVSREMLRLRLRLRSA